MAVMNDESASAQYWSRPAREVMAELASSAGGLDSATALERQRRCGPNRAVSDRPGNRALRLFLDQFRSPLVLILIFAALVALAVNEMLDASIILAIVFSSALLGFVQEYRAGSAVEKLKQQVSVKATVLRDGRLTTVP